MRILVTNDDGIHAPGIFALKRALAPLGELFVVAPERPRSAAGHSITLHKPLRITSIQFPDGTEGFASNGTPSDCVTLGFDIVMEQKCDLVVSGINLGPNLGWDVTYSGTVSAAMEGAVLGIPAFAVSVATEPGGPTPVDFAPAAAFAAQLAQSLAEAPLPPNTLLNVNFPPVSASELKGVRVTHQGTREYVDRIITREDPFGRPYYWQAGSIREDNMDAGSDVHAILERFVSVTPIRLDLTDYDQLAALKLRGLRL